jgi:hypothetical protein
MQCSQDWQKNAFEQHVIVWKSPGIRKHFLAFLGEEGRLWGLESRVSTCYESYSIPHGGWTYQGTSNWPFSRSCTAKAHFEMFVELGLLFLCHISPTFYYENIQTQNSWKQCNECLRTHPTPTWIQCVEIFYIGFILLQYIIFFC